MATEIERFTAALTSDVSLRDKLESHSSDLPSLVSFANQNGFSITEEEIKALANPGAEGELSETQLEMVAGGVFILVSGTATKGIAVSTAGNILIWGPPTTPPLPTEPPPDPYLPP